jgi:CRISPR-associated protein Cmr3
VSTTRTRWLSFTPRDTVFVRDGRAFDAASDAAGATVRPGPTTIAGALGAAFGTEPLAVRGPVLARQGADGRWTPYFPVPADLVETSDRPWRVYRMTPDAAGLTDLCGPRALKSPGTETGLRFLVPPSEAEPARPVEGWLPGDVLARYLAGGFPGPGGVPREDLRIVPDDDLGIKEPLVPELRVGLAREGRTVREGHLYQATHLRPRDGWGFLAEYDVPGDWAVRARSEVSFGGRGRVADVAAADLVQTADADWPGADWPEGSPPGPDKRVLVYLATPAVWREGWRLPVPEGATLVAAAMPGEPEPTATAKRDQRQWRASRVLRWAVPAGSTYLLEFADAARGAAWARKWNGVALDRGVPENPDMIRTAGFGVVLTGAWT